MCWYKTGCICLYVSSENTSINNWLDIKALLKFSQDLCSILRLFCGGNGEFCCLCLFQWVIPRVMGSTSTFLVKVISPWVTWIQSSEDISPSSQCCFTLNSRWRVSARGLSSWVSQLQRAKCSETTHPDFCIKKTDSLFASSFMEWHHFSEQQPFLCPF